MRMRTTEGQLNTLREYARLHGATAVPKIRQLVALIGQGLSAVGRRVMLSPEVGSAIALGLADLQPPQPAVASAAQALLSELAQYSVSTQELDALSLRSFIAHRPALGRAIDAGLSCIIDGVPLAADQRGELDAYVASECDSMAIAVVSLLRAIDARTSEATDAQ